MEEPHPVPVLAQVTSAHIPLVRTTYTDPPSCKGGWEPAIVLLQQQDRFGEVAATLDFVYVLLFPHPSIHSL